MFRSHSKDRYIHFIIVASRFNFPNLHPHSFPKTNKGQSNKYNNMYFQHPGTPRPFFRPRLITNFFQFKPHVVLHVPFLFTFSVTTYVHCCVICFYTFHSLHYHSPLFVFHPVQTFLDRILIFTRSIVATSLKTFALDV